MLKMSPCDDSVRRCHCFYDKRYCNKTVKEKEKEKCNETRARKYINLKYNPRDLNLVYVPDERQHQNDTQSEYPSRSTEHSWQSQGSRSNNEIEDINESNLRQRFDLANKFKVRVLCLLQKLSRLCAIC